MEAPFFISPIVTAKRLSQLDGGRLQPPSHHSTWRAVVARTLWMAALLPRSACRSECEYNFKHLAAFHSEHCLISTKLDDANLFKPRTETRIQRDRHSSRKLWKSLSFSFRNQANKIKNTKRHKSDNSKIVFFESALVRRWVVTNPAV